MTLPFLNIPLTTTHLLIGAGSVGGLSAVSYGGYYIYDSTHSGYGRTLMEKGYEWNILKADNLNTTAHTTDTKWKIERSGCFDKFFPGVDDISTNNSNAETSGFSDNVTITNHGKETNPIGCILSKINWTDKDHFTYRSEITVKNDHFGWAVWSHQHKNGVPAKTVKRPSDLGGSSEVLDYDYTLWTYHILFLEKNSENKWEVKGGYYLADLQYYTYITHAASIVLPGGKNWLSGSFKNTTYSGIWTPSSKGKEVFEDIKFKYAGWKNSWLGRRRGNGSLFEVNDFRFNGFYDSNQKKWMSSRGSTVTGISTKLENHYEPFKGKRGHWRTTQEYCSKLFYKKSPSAVDAKRLEEFCFTKKDS